MLQITTEEQRNGFKDKFFIYLSPIAKDYEENEILFEMKEVETMFCNCIKMNQIKNKNE